MPQIAGLDSPAFLGRLAAVLHPMTMNHHALAQGGVPPTVMRHADFGMVMAPRPRLVHQRAMVMTMVMTRGRRFDRLMMAMVVMPPSRRRLDGAVVMMVSMMSSRRGHGRGGLHRAVVAVAPPGRRSLGRCHGMVAMVVVVNWRINCGLGPKHRRRQGESGHKGDLDGESHSRILTPFRAARITLERVAPAGVSTPWARGPASPH